MKFPLDFEAIVFANGCPNAARAPIGEGMTRANCRIKATGGMHMEEQRVLSDADIAALKQALLARFASGADDLLEIEQAFLTVWELTRRIAKTQMLLVGAPGPSPVPSEPPCTGEQPIPATPRDPASGQP